MYLKNMNDDVKELIKKVNILGKENKLKFISYVFNLWDRNQINSFNPNLLDDSIDYKYLVNEIKEYWNYNYNLYRLYPKEYKEVIPVF